MSGVLFRWLRDDIGIDEAADSSLEPLFSSGYAFAKVFDRYGVLSQVTEPLSKFVDQGTAEDRVRNFKQLLPAFHAVGVRLDAAAANRVICEDAGMAAQILLILRSKLESLPLASSTSKKATDLGASSAAPAKRFEPVSSKKTFDAMEAAQFEKSLRKLCSAKDAEQRLVLHAKRWEHEADRQARDRQAASELRETQKRQSQDEFRATQMETMARRRETSSKKHELHCQNHAATQKIFQQREQYDLQIELSKAEKSKKLAQRTAEEHAFDVTDGIDAFEGRMSRLGLDPGASSAVQPAFSGADGMAHALQPSTTVEHQEKMDSRLPAGLQGALQKAGAYVQSIKSRKAEELEARKEREKRRRKLVVDQIDIQRSLDAKRTEELELDRLRKWSSREKDVASELETLRRNKEIMFEHRRRREAEYAAQRDREFAERNAVERAIAVREREEYVKQAADLRERAADLRRAAEQAKHAEISSWIEDSCIRGMLECLVFRTADLRTVSSHELVRPSIWRQWKAEWIAGWKAISSDTQQEVAASHKPASQLVIPFSSSVESKILDLEVDEILSTQLEEDELRSAVGAIRKEVAAQIDSHRHLLQPEAFAPAILRSSAWSSSHDPLRLVLLRRSGVEDDGLVPAIADAVPNVEAVSLAGVLALDWSKLADSVGEEALARIHGRLARGLPATPEDLGILLGRHCRRLLSQRKGFVVDGFWNPALEACLHDIDGRADLPAVDAVVIVDRDSSSSSSSSSSLQEGGEVGVLESRFDLQSRSSRFAAAVASISDFHGQEPVEMALQEQEEDLGTFLESLPEGRLLFSFGSVIARDGVAGVVECVRAIAARHVPRHRTRIFGKLAEAKSLSDESVQRSKSLSADSRVDSERLVSYFETLLSRLEQVTSDLLRPAFSKFAGQALRIRYDAFSSIQEFKQRFLDRLVVSLQDDRQTTMHELILSSNSGDAWDGLRDDAQAKAELHQRTQEAWDRISGMIDEKKIRAEKEIEAIQTDFLLSDFCDMLRFEAYHLIQSEVDAFFVELQFMLDARAALKSPSDLVERHAAPSDAAPVEADPKAKGKKGTAAAAATAAPIPESRPAAPLTATSSLEVREIVSALVAEAASTAASTKDSKAKKEAPLAPAVAAWPRAGNAMPALASVVTAVIDRVAAMGEPASLHVVDLRRRLEKLVVEEVESVISELRDLTSKAISSLAHAVQIRIQEETHSLEYVVAEILKSIEAEAPLFPTALARLVSAGVVIDQSLLSAAPSFVLLPVRQPSDILTSEGCALQLTSKDIIDVLCPSLESTNGGGMLGVDDTAAYLCKNLLRLEGVSTGSGDELVKIDTLQQALGLFENPRTGECDWRQWLLGCVLEDPVEEELLVQICLAHPSSSEKLVQALFGDANVALANALSRVFGPLPVMRTALYLAADRISAAGLRRALAVAHALEHGQEASPVAVTASDMWAVLWDHAPRRDYSIDEVQGIVETVFGRGEPLALDQLPAASVAGQLLFDQCQMYAFRSPASL